MILKLLNGDLLVLDDISYPPRLFDHYTYLKKVIKNHKLRERVAAICGTHPNQIRFVPRTRDERGADISNVVADACVFITPRPFIDLSHHVFSNTSDTLPPFYDYANVTDASDENVRILLEYPYQFAYVTGFCVNPNDRLLDWLIDHPEFISYPQFLGNSNPRAVQIAIDWLSKNYNSLKTNFDANPELTNLYIRYLEYNTNPDMFVYVWYNCEYLRPNNPLKQIAKCGDIDVVFQFNRKTGFL